MIISKPHLTTKLEVFAPKYSTKWTNDGEPVALLHKRKVDFASPNVIVWFSKAKDLEGQRFAIKKTEAQKHPVTTNGAAEMYKIPLSHLESYVTGSEVMEEIEIIWPAR